MLYLKVKNEYRCEGTMKQSHKFCVCYSVDNQE